MQKCGFIPCPMIGHDCLILSRMVIDQREKKDKSCPKNSCSWSSLALSPSFYWISSLWLGSDQKLFPCWRSFDQVLKVSSFTMRVGRISWIFGPSTEYDINSNQLTGSGPFILSITAEMNAGQRAKSKHCNVVMLSLQIVHFLFSLSRPDCKT